MRDTSRNRQFVPAAEEARLRSEAHAALALVSSTDLASMLPVLKRYAATRGYAECQRPALRLHVAGEPSRPSTPPWH